MKPPPLLFVFIVAFRRRGCYVWEKRRDMGEMQNAGQERAAGGGETRALAPARDSQPASVLVLVGYVGRGGG